MPRLSEEEREFSKSREAPLRYWWPLVPILVAVGFVGMDAELFERCTGDPIDSPGRGGAITRMIAGVACSHHLLQGSPLDWILFALIWGPAPLLILSWRRSRRHKAYWDGVRKRQRDRQRERRAEQRLQKNAEQATGAAAEE